jgi:hypothetical protein
MNNFFKNNYHILTYVFLYSSIIIAFYFDENVAGGPKYDLQYTLKQVAIFDENFIFSFLNYDKIEYPNRLSPVYISLLLLFKKVFFSLEIARFVLLHILILSQLFFYKCLKLVYKKKYSLDKQILFFLSCIIFISPSFRSNIIWVESSMFGLLFFLIGLYYFLKNLKKFNLKNVSLNIFFIAIASYIRPSYCLFAIYFFYFYFTFFRNKVSIYYITFLNIFLAFPAFYYVFVLDIFFIKWHIGSQFSESNFNYFNKIAIIISIIIFHSIPFLYYKKFFLSNLIKKKLLIFFTLIASGILILNFDYNMNNAGGGIFLHISNFVSGNNYLFYWILPFFIFCILNILKIKLVNNLIIILVLLLITPQYHIFHKYYDPLVFILCLTLIDLNLNADFFEKKRFIAMSFLLFFSHYLISFINTYYIKF